MSILFESPVKNSIVVYLFIAIIILLNKPECLFHENGKIIEFGTGDNQSLINYPVILSITSIFVTFFFEYFHLKKY
jgi:hypothetical protein